MIEFLKLCGYEDPEIVLELPRVKKAFDKLAINTADIERGKQRLAKYYDIELKGIRKVFRLCLHEFVNSLLAKDEDKKHIIYGFMTPGMDVLGSILVNRSKEIFSIHHSWAFHIIVGCIFDKLNPILEDAEKKWLKAGLVAHCANVKTILGPVALGIMPKPDLLITSGFLCETSPKTLDLMHEMYEIPVFYFDTCLDREFREYDAANQRAAELAAKSARRLSHKIQEIVGFEVTDAMLWEVLNAKSKLDTALRRLRDLVISSDPLPLSPTLENIWMCLRNLTLNTDELAEAVAAIDTLYQELQARVNRKEGIVEKGAPRVLAILPSGQTDPRFDHLVCEVGIAIAALDTSFSVPFKQSGNDPYIQFAANNLLHSLGTVSARRIPLIVEGCKKLKVDGVLDRYHVGCRAVAGDAMLIKNAVEKEVGIPVLLMEWENFDSRIYNREQYKKKLEIFKTMMLNKSGTAAGK
jgi:benzoyl-CoA reductase/2-hydroxyglutaryl-CoA dehydratase subunit BcrC/BadD/HgdB